MVLRPCPIGILDVSVKEFVEMLEEGFALELPQLTDYELNLIMFRITQILAERNKKTR